MLRNCVGLHSDREYMILDSLVECAQLAVLLLLRLAEGDLVWPH